MDQETFNLSIRKFLKMVGVNSQREIEQAVQKAIMDELQGNEVSPHARPSKSLSSASRCPSTGDQTKIAA